AFTLKVSDLEMREIAVRRATETLREWVQELRLAEEPEMEIGIGTPLEVVLKKVRTIEADLLVLGEVGSSVPGYGAGILATSCLRKAPCKVMLVNAGQRQAFRVVLACIDFSETSRLVARQALHVAAQENCQVHFLHVADA